VIAVSDGSGIGGGTAIAVGDATGVGGGVVIAVGDGSSFGGGTVIAVGDGSGTGGGIVIAVGDGSGFGGGVVIAVGDAVGIERGVSGADESGALSGSGLSSHDPRTDSSDGAGSSDDGAPSDAGGSMSHDARTDSSEESTSEDAGWAGTAGARAALGGAGSFGAGAKCRPGMERDSGGAEAVCGAAETDRDESRAGRMDRACRRTSSTRAALIEDLDPPNALSALASVAASGNRVSGFFSRHRSTTSARPFEIDASKSRGERGAADMTFARTCETESPSNGIAPVRSS
jgi:hypothetical protein